MKGLGAMARVLGWVYRDFGIKLFALFLAVIFWFHVRTEHVYDVTRGISIKYSMPSDKYVVVNQLPENVKVRLRAKGKALIVLSMSNAYYPVDLTQLKPGKRVIKLEEDKLVFPSYLDFEVLSLSPKEIQVVIDKKSTRTIPVKLDIKNAPPDGYVLFSQSIKPDTVKITGPSRFITRFKHILTEPIDISGSKGRVHKKVKLVAPSRSFEISPDRVEVLLDIEPLKTARIENIPIRVHVNKRYTGVVKPGSLQVEIKGPKPVVDTLGWKDIGIDLWLTKFKPGKYKFRVRPRVPRTVELISYKPESVLVTIHRAKKGKRTR